MHHIAMKYGQLPTVIDALPIRVREEMHDAVLDLAEYEAEAWKPDEPDEDES